nr:hypothetical protein GCM10020063_008200 [Dactylosporangium thailandense]
MPSGFAHSCSVSDFSPATSTFAPHNRAAIDADTRSGRLAGQAGFAGGAATTGCGAATAVTRDAARTSGIA